MIGVGRKSEPMLKKVNSHKLYEKLIKNNIYYMGKLSICWGKFYNTAEAVIHFGAKTHEICPLKYIFFTYVNHTIENWANKVLPNCHPFGYGSKEI